VFYESLLPSVAHTGELDRVSARGYALGYLGGGLLLVVNAAWVMLPGRFGLPSTTFAIKLSFFSVALWWAVFSWPLFRRVPEPPAGGVRGARAVLAGLARLRSTFLEIRRFRHLALFLLAFWIYNDGISTIIKMATAYGDEIGIGLSHMVGALVLTQFIGFPCSLLFGSLAQRIGAKTAVVLSLAVYTLICVGGFCMTTPLHFYILAALVGTVQGGSQALSRSLYALMVPRHKAAEFFGFFSASGKMAGIAGPLVFAVVTQAAGEGRMGIFSLIAFFLLGGSLLLCVNVDEGAQQARLAETEG
jgi:UMF1 family MFS transporter